MRAAFCTACDRHAYAGELNRRLTNQGCRMSRFYFHIESPIGLLRDDEGTELQNISTARAEAIEAAREIAANALRAGTSDVPHRIIIASETGEKLGAVSLREAVPETLRSQLLS